MRKPLFGGRLRARLPIVVALATALTLATDASATDNFWNVGAGSWTVDGNWLSNAGESYTPDATFEEVAIINNGGVATLSSAAPDVAGLVLGQAAGESGTLIVASGGSLSLIETTGAADAVAPVGIANIALAGEALLEVHGGGSFTTTSLDVNATGTVRIGGVGAGAATVTSTGNLFNDGLFEIYGGGHNVSATGNASFEGNSVYAPTLTSATPTVFEATGTIFLGGTLAISTDGYTPSMEDRWVLMEGAAISGGFAAIDPAGLPALPAGSEYRASVVAGGAGSQLVFGTATVLSLQVDYQTGEVVLINPSTTGSVEIDGYSVISASGLLDPSAGAWNSLSDQGAPGWDEAASSATSLNELVPTGASTLGPGASYSLGSVYDPSSAAFGVDPKELVFQYREADGYLATAAVEYSNTIANNLLLTVDPETGEAQLKNDSTYTVAIDGYTVLSDSGSLLTEGWSSLSEQGMAAWEEASPTANALSELLMSGGLTLGPGAAYDLGALFDTTGVEDLGLEFKLAGDVVGSTGVVVYGEISEGVSGDYNHDGVVDAADYTVWRDGLSLDSSAAGYSTWASNYGVTAGAGAASAVPEPSSALLLGAALLTASRRLIPSAVS